MHADVRTPAPTTDLQDLDEDQVALAVEVFRMLADHTRVRLLWVLLEQELSVGQLAAAVDKPAAGVSQHLAKLRMARLVRTRSQGTQVFYRIDSGHVRQLVQDAVLHADHARAGIPVHHRADPGARPLTQARPGPRRDA